MHSAAEYFRTLADLLDAVQVTDGEGRALALQEGGDRAAALIESVRAGSRKILLVGNGGSAAISSHMQNDFCHAAGVRSMAFTDAAMLTALSNDHGYPEAFERCVRMWAAPDDLLIAVSSSGRSENILRGVRAAREGRAAVLTCSGFRPDNPLRSMGDVNFYVGSGAYGPVELAHHAILHYLSDRVAKRA
ncbi:MAG: SIS domain-containing protein [Planctomycetes bacterium]|nr:SIS domain-containing protein [Planctomycetota bacterium]